MIVGLTGRNASGKTEIASYLKEKGYSYHSLSDVLREEAKRRGIEEAREKLIELGNDMRRRHGSGVLARMIKLKGNCVVDSIRNPGEVEELRKHKDFMLLGVDAPIELRFKRALQRGRDAKTLKEFKALEERENLKNRANQQLDRCLEMADRVIVNDGTIEELRRKVDQVIE